MGEGARGLLVVDDQDVPRERLVRGQGVEQIHQARSVDRAGRDGDEDDGPGHRRTG